MNTDFSTGEYFLRVQESYIIMYPVKTDDMLHAILAALREQLQSLYYLF